MNNTSDKRHSLEQRIRAGVLAGTLTLTALGSGCATPEDFMLGGLAAGALGLSPHITPGQAVVLGLARDTATIGAGVSAQRESSERIAQALEGQRGGGGYGVSGSSGDSSAYRRINTRQFGVLEMYIGKAPLGYNGERGLSSEEITLQSTFGQGDYIYFQCTTEHKMRNLIVKMLDERGGVLHEDVASQRWTNGKYSGISPGNKLAGTFALAFYAIPSGAIVPKYQDTLLFLGSLPFIIRE